MAKFAAFLSTIMEASFGRLHNSGAGASGTRPTVVESIMVIIDFAVTASGAHFSNSFVFFLSVFCFA